MSGIVNYAVADNNEIYYSNYYNSMRTECQRQTYYNESEFTSRRTFSCKAEKDDYAFINKITTALNICTKANVDQKQEERQCVDLGGSSSKVFTRCYIFRYMHTNHPLQNVVLIYIERSGLTNLFVQVW